jgi:hypothetical protein
LVSLPSAGLFDGVGNGVEEGLGEDEGVGIGVEEGLGEATTAAVCAEVRVVVVTPDFVPETDTESLFPRSLSWTKYVNLFCPVIGREFSSH